MKTRLSSVALLIISTLFLACSPSGGGGAKQPDPFSPIDVAFFEKFITRHPDKSGAELDMKINFSEDTKEMVWMVAVMAVAPGTELDRKMINPGAPTTNNIHFNWIDRTVPVQGMPPITLNAPMPFYAPLYTDTLSTMIQGLNTFPHDPGVVYLEEEKFNATSIKIIFDELITNSTNENKVGALNKATAWNEFKAGDNVDLVFFIYTPIPKQNFQWFIGRFTSEVVIGGGDVLDILADVKVGGVIELGRQSITLQ